MAKNKAKMNKFLTGAITATMVASAVAPLASAASFTDTDNVGDKVKAEIDKAVELGFFIDAEKFNPANTLNRSQAALTLARYISGTSDLKSYVETKELEKTVTPFTDVPASLKDGAAYQAELYYASLIVKNAGAFTQDTLNPTGELTRSQMAKVITEAFELTKPADFKSKVTDIAHLDATTKNYIETLEANGVTDVTDFRPAGQVTRSQMASFLVRAYDAVNNAVTKEYQIRVTPEQKVIQANGADNTVVKFELLGPNGQVDTNANNIVLEVGTTFGKLANSRVTVQNGVGQIVLQSEFATRDIVAKVTAQIIEASSDEYKELIGKIAGETTVTFSPANVTTDPNAVTFQDAESNQADRVVLYFDKAVSPETFVQTNADGTFKTDVTRTKQILKDNVSIIVEQNGDSKEVVGIIPVKGNDKAVEVLVAKEDYLTDNAKVDLDVKIGTTRNQRSFVLTDARQPEFTGVSVKNLRTLDLTFSESYADGKFKIDGILDGVTTLPGVNQFQVVPGEFNAVKGIDNRHTATVHLGKVKKDGQEIQNYFTAGQHSITVNQLKDWAGLTDEANVSTSQSLDFTVQADEVLPKAEVVVETPEQFRLVFNRDVDAILGSKTLDELFNDAFKVYNKDAKEWQKLSSHSAFKAENANIPLHELLTVTKINAAENTEYVVELRSDWTQLMVDKNDVYYNYEFQFDFAKQSFLNLTNGKESEAFKLDLSTDGSALTKADNLSPEIADIKQNVLDASIYEVVMNEPVKLNAPNAEGDNAGDTLATNQPSLPVVQAEFQGKDEKGNAVVIKANILGYSDLDGADKRFTIQTEETKQLQALVNKGYAEDWTVVVRSISDDIGNTAATLTKDFVVKKDVVETGFKIVATENDFLEHKVIAYDATERGQKDRVEVTFTQAVNAAGAHNLTSTANWTLNGNNLSTLSNVESIKLVDTNNNEKDGYEKVVITFKDDLAFGNHSNVVSVNKNIQSLNGTVLSGAHEVVAKTVAWAEEDTTPGTPDPGQGLVLKNLPADAWEIQNNTDVDKWGVVLNYDKLPAELQGAESYTITIDGVTYELTKNQFNSNKFNGNVDSTKHTKAEVEAGVIEKVVAPSAVLGDLAADAWEIQDNTDVDKWGVVLNHDKLPTALQGATSYVITIDGATYELTKNQFNPSKFNGNADSTKHTKAEVEKGIITKK